MNTATRTIQLTIPESDIYTAERISRGMGWKLFILDDAENEEERRKDAEEFARKLSITEDDYQELRAHDFYLHEKPEQAPVFKTAEEEVAYLDSLDEEGYLSEEESEKYLELWRNL